MSYHYNPVVRQRFSIRCLGVDRSIIQVKAQPCTFISEASSAGEAEDIAREHINKFVGSENDGFEEPNLDHTVIITPITVVSRQID